MWSLTRSPMVSRINRLRIFPEMCARTRCSLARATRNMVPGRTDMIVPSNSRAFSEFMIKCRPASKISKPAATIDSDLPTIARERTLGAVWARTLFARTRFADTQRASVQFLAVKRADSSFRFGFFIHGDERKAARFAGHAVHHQRYFADLAMLFEKILKIVFSGLKREITYVQFHCDFWSKLASYRAVPGNRVSNHQ